MPLRRFARRAIPVLVAAATLGGAAASAQPYYPGAPPPYAPPPGPPPGPPGYPPPPPPRFGPVGYHCEATRPSPYGPRSFFCPIRPRPFGAGCGCPTRHGYAPGRVVR